MLSLLAVFVVSGAPTFAQESRGDGAR
eukprot:COSAG02_NODE_11639_length_1684_cov_4.815142_1_plen_26_part_10